MARGVTRLLSTSQIIEATTAFRAGDGTAAVPSYSFIADTDTGFFRSGADAIDVSLAGTARFRFGTIGPQLASTDSLAWSSGGIGATSDVLLLRDAANILAQRNGVNAQTFRVYGTTTNNNFASLAHNGTDTLLTTSGGFIIIGASNVGVKQQFLDYTDTSGGVTGNQTLNKMAGSVNIAATGTAVTVTNSLVTTSSKIMAVIGTNDATARLANVVASAGSFVVNLTAAATAETRIHWFVMSAN